MMMSVRRLIPVLLVVVGVLVFGVGSAVAGVPGFEYGFSFGGGFSAPVGIGVDQSSGDVYVLDQGSVDALEKFSVSGNAATLLWSQSLPSVPNQLTVDNYSGPDDGDVFVASVTGEAVYRVNESDTEVTKVGSGMPYPTGVAVDEAGDFFVSLDLNGAVAEYNANWEPINAEGTVVSEPGNWVVTGMQPGGGAEEANPQTVAVTPNGQDLYVPTTAGTVQYTISGADYAVGATIDPAGKTGVVVAPSGNVFVDQANEVAEYEGSAPYALLTSFGLGTLQVGYGLGVYGTNVYVADDGAATVQVFEEEEVATTLFTPVTEAAVSNGSQAVLHGELLGGEKHYYFDYNTGGVCTGGGQTGSISTEGVAKVSATVSVPALHAGVPYTFCIVAENRKEAKLGSPLPVEIQLSAPTDVKTTNPTEVRPSRMRLNGEFNPGGDATYYFEYGTEPCATAKTPCVKTPEEGPFEAGTEQSGTAAITGLIAGNTYYYRIVAVNSQAPAGVDGNEETITPEGETPASLSTEPAEEVLESSAYLAGELNPGGGADYYFEYGTTPCTNTSCGTRTVEEGPVSGEAKKVIESTLVTSLQPGTTYYYWLVATNGHGTVHGAQKAFTTRPAAIVLVTPPTSGGTTTNTPVVTTNTTTTTKTATTTTKKTTAPTTLTRAQKLAKALKACKRTKSKGKRLACERQAHKRYAPPKPKKHQKKR